jgi:hypothetical protein
VPVLPSILIRLFGLCIQAIKLGTSITFVYTFIVVMFARFTFVSSVINLFYSKQLVLLHYQHYRCLFIFRPLVFGLRDNKEDFQIVVSATTNNTSSASMPKCFTCLGSLGHVTKIEHTPFVVSATTNNTSSAIDWCAMDAHLLFLIWLLELYDKNRTFPICCQCHNQQHQ